jgi:uncharacterized protein YjbI with pentapeptide repeats
VSSPYTVKQGSAKPQSMAEFEAAKNRGYVRGIFHLNGVLDATFTDVVFDEATLIGGSLSCSEFERCTWKDVKIVGTVLEFVEFRNCTIRDLTLRNCWIDQLEINGGTTERLVKVECYGEEAKIT